MPHTKERELITLHFNRVYDESFDAVRRFAAARCSDPDQLSDLLQEIWFEYYGVLTRKGTDYVKDPLALLYKIARRKTFGYWSLKKELMKLVPISTAEAELELPDMWGDAEEVAISSAEAERIWELLSLYPAETRKVIYLYFYEDMSLPEISRAMGWSLSNVKNRLYRTLNDIREKERSEQDA